MSFTYGYKDWSVNRPAISHLNIIRPFKALPLVQLPNNKSHWVFYSKSAVCDVYA